MSIQATIVLDSGIFLRNDKELPLSSIEVGYFNPRIVIYVDGAESASFEPEQIGRELEVSFDAGDGRAREIDFSACMFEKMLRFSDLYDGDKPPVMLDDPFETTITLNAGHFRCSGVKERYFYEMHGAKKVGRKCFGRMAHDVVIEYDMSDNGVLTLKDGGNFYWSSSQTSHAKRRIDIEILAEDCTAEKFYARAFGIDPEKEPDRTYYLPNQGHPPPVWVP